MLGPKIVLWLACLTPAALLAWRAWTGDLTANPIEYITLQTGTWALILLMVTLAVTPIRRITGWNRVVQLRRPLGLFAFFYALLHFATYIVLDQFFEWEYILEDIAERPYITVGFIAWVFLLLLALTSTRGWIRRLGRNWQRLHWAIYPAAALGVLHFYWKRSSKNDVFEPLLFAAILALLLGIRLVFNYIRRRRKATS